MKLNLPIQSKISNLECLKRWWNCVIKNKKVKDAIYEAIKDNMHLAELEPLGISEKICIVLKEENINSVKDLMLLTFDSLSKIEGIGLKNLLKILKALRNLYKLEEEKEIYIKSIFPNIDDLVTIKYDFFNITNEYMIQ